MIPQAPETFIIATAIATSAKACVLEPDIPYLLSVPVSVSDYGVQRCNKVSSVDPIYRGKFVKRFYKYLLEFRRAAAIFQSTT